MCRQTAVLGPDRPAVIILTDPVCAQIEHRLNRQHHAGDKSRSPYRGNIIGYIDKNRLLRLLNNKTIHERNDVADVLRACFQTKMYAVCKEKI